MAALNIRDISPDLIRGLKLTAISEGKTLKEYVIDALLAAIAKSGTTKGGSNDNRKKH